MEGPGGGEDEVSECAYEAEDDDGDAAGDEPVGKVCAEEDEEEGEDVGRSGESLSVCGGVAHIVYYGWKEDGEGGEGDIAEEEHGLLCNQWYISQNDIWYRVMIGIAVS